MDGFQAFETFEHDPAILPITPAFKTWAPAPVDGLIERRLGGLQSLVATKLAAGFDDDAVEHLSRLVDDLAAGRRGPVKYLVLDFAHHVDRDAEAGEGFAHLVDAVANLVMDAPVVTVAAVRAHMSGADLELALACNMMIAEDGRRFSFAADPMVSVATYGLLSQKLGFVRAERLMESAVALDSLAMSELLLVKAVMEPGAGFAGIERFLDRSSRRHNASCGIYRAQRIAHPVAMEAMTERRIA